jgi:branched-chain amino acid transport system ATP-binding protein
MLEVEGIDAFYGRSQVLFGMGLQVGAGEVVTLMGRNGMGKTTTVKAVMGLLPVAKGAVRFAGQAIDRLPPYRIAQLGLGLVPEGRHIFPNLTARENLVATARPGGAWALEQVFDLFPRLAARQAAMGSQLSGGEQQMLAIGRALMTNPRLLILDEATEGLAPLIREEIWRCLGRLKAAGQSILLIDKTVDALARIGDRHYIMEKGRIVWQGDSAALAGDRALQMRYLGV